MSEGVIRKDPMQELLELALMLLALIALIMLGRFLSNNGAFDLLKVERQSIGPLLVAVTNKPAVLPGLHPAMEQLYEVAAARGVTEESSLLGDPPLTITRGELIGVYHAPIRPRMSADAELGVVLDVGQRRVHEEARLGWQNRLQRSGVDDVSIRILQVSEALCLHARHEGWIAEMIAQWRIYRKLLRHWLKGSGRGLPNVVVETISKNRGRVLVSLPMDCTKSVYVS